MRVRRPPALVMAEGRSQSPPLSPSAVPGARTHDDMQDVDSEAQRAAAPATLYRQRVKWSWDSVASLFDEAGAVRSVNFDNLDTSEVKGDAVLILYRYWSGIYHSFDSFEKWYGIGKSGIGIGF